MIRRLAGRGGLLAVIVFAGYLASYALLWTTQEEKLFALTREHGCFVQKRDVPALRYVWTQQPGFGRRTLRRAWASEFFARISFEMEMKKGFSRAMLNRALR